MEYINNSNNNKDEMTEVKNNCINNFHQKIKFQKY